MPTTLCFVVGISRFQRRFRALGALLVALVFASAVAGLSPAGAQDPNGTVGTNGDGGVVSATFAPDGITTGSSNSGPVARNGDPAPPTFAPDAIFPWTCEFGNLYFGIPTSDPAYTTEVPTPGSRYHLMCSVNPGWDTLQYMPIDDINYVYNPTGALTGEPQSVTAFQVREFAESLAIPPTLPVGLSPEVTQITGIDTWFWPDGATDTVTATASAGGLVVTIEARYVRTEFTIGGPGGDSFTCTNFLEWTPGATNSPCTYSFTEETPNETVSAASQWDLYWFDNALQPVPVVYASIINTEVSNVEVIDLEAVITR